MTNVIKGNFKKGALNSTPGQGKYIAETTDGSSLNREVVQVYKDELHKLIDQRDEAETEEQALYSLLTEFIMSNHLDDMWIEFLQETRKRELEDESNIHYYGDLDDHIKRWSEK